MSDYRDLGYPTGGPRIVFKDDRDSSIGRGAVLYWPHLVSPMVGVLIATAQTAPKLVDDVLLVTEAWRPVRPSGDQSRDLHRELRAFDFSLNGIAGVDGFSDRRTAGQFWAERIRADLGRGYQVLVHGAGANLHIHVEFDP